MRRFAGLTAGLLVLALLAGARADIIILKDGTKIDGKVQGSTAEKLWIKTRDGKTVIVERSKIKEHRRTGWEPKEPVKAYKCKHCWDTGLMTCPKCLGQKKGQCITCRGTGYERCPDCPRAAPDPARPDAPARGTGKVRCPQCEGRGKVAVRVIGGGTRRYTQCPKCRGLGTITCPRCAGDGRITCRRCRGTKVDPAAPCEACGGTGKVKCAYCKAGEPPAPPKPEPVNLGDMPRPKLDGKPLAKQQEILRDQQRLLFLRKERERVEREIAEIIRRLKAEE